MPLIRPLRHAIPCDDRNSKRKFQDAIGSTVAGESWGTLAAAGIMTITLLE